MYFFALTLHVIMWPCFFFDSSLEFFLNSWIVLKQMGRFHILAPHKVKAANFGHAQLTRSLHLEANTSQNRPNRNMSVCWFMQTVAIVEAWPVSMESHITCNWYISLKLHFGEPSGRARAHLFFVLTLQLGHSAPHLYLVPSLPTVPLTLRLSPYVLQTTIAVLKKIP